VGENISSQTNGADHQGHHQPSSSDPPRPRSGLKDIRHTDEERREDAPDVVRPGRFFSTLHAMKTELEQQASSMDVHGAAQTLALLSRLDQVQREGLVALDRLQRRGSSKGSSTSMNKASLKPVAAASRDGYDYDLEVTAEHVLHGA